MATATEEKIVAEENELDGQDAEKGKLFEVPRVAVTVDDSDPNVLKLSFSGSIELERGNASDVALYNKLKPGSNHDLNLGVFVAGPKTTHRRDADGNVDSVAQTKTIVIHSLTDA
jgi:hypothetical protein